MMKCYVATTSALAFVVAGGALVADNGPRFMVGLVFGILGLILVLTK
jgi:hypothetical protein